MYHYRYTGAPPKKRIHYRGILPLVVFFLLIAVGILLLKQQGFFTFSTISVKGSDPVVSKKIQDYLQKNYAFLLSFSDSALVNLRQTFPELERASLTPNIFSKSLTVSYELRKGYFLWCKEETCFLVDKKGIIFAPSQITQASFLLTVQDDYFFDLAIGKKIPYDYIEALLALEQMAKRKELVVERYIIGNIFAVRVKLKDAGEIKFTMQQPIKEQVDTFIVFYDATPKAEFARLQYVDLRVKDKVYYK